MEHLKLFYSPQNTTSEYYILYSYKELEIFQFSKLSSTSLKHLYNNNIRCKTNCKMLTNIGLYYLYGYMVIFSCHLSMTSLDDIIGGHSNDADKNCQKLAKNVHSGCDFMHCYIVISSPPQDIYSTVERGPNESSLNTSKSGWIIFCFYRVKF